MARSARCSCPANAAAMRPGMIITRSVVATTCGATRKLGVVKAIRRGTPCCLRTSSTSPPGSPRGTTSAWLALAKRSSVTLYLAHMDEEERQFEPAIRAVLSADEATAFGRRSVERTAPADQRMMLGWMLPAMTSLDADAVLGRLPLAFAAELGVLVDPSPATGRSG